MHDSCSNLLHTSSSNQAEGPHQDAPRLLQNARCRQVHTDKAQKEYVDLTETEAWLAAAPGKKIVTCRKCEKPGHIAKDCPVVLKSDTK